MRLAIFFLSSIMLVACILAQPIKSNVSGNCVKSIQVNRQFTTLDYVQDGLVAMWDGIENAGIGVHDANATVWIDIKSGMVVPFNDTFSYNRTYYWRDTYLEMDGYRTGYVVDTADVVKHALASNCTIELVADVGLNYGSVSCLFTYIGDSSGFLARNTYTSNSGQSSALFSNNFMWRFARPMFRSYTCGGTSEYYYVRDTITIDGTIGKHYWIDQNGERRTDSWTAIPGNANGSIYEVLASNKIKAYSCRIYSRALKLDEIIRNHQIDKVRFNIQ